jgi:hypothetical protein
MISNETMKRSDAGALIDKAVDVTISVETMKHRSETMIGREFPLVFWRGAGRILGSDDTSVALLVRGVRVDLTWERLTTTWKRVLSNHTLSVDELGGGADAVGIVSLFALMQGDSVAVGDLDGLLVLKAPADTPVHQYADMSRPTSWAPWRRKIHGA